MEFAAKFQGVLARRVGNLIYKLRDRVGALELRPFKTAQSREKVTAETDARQTSSKSAAHACVQSVRRGRRVEIARQRRLVQAVVAGAKLIYPLGTGSPNPVAAEHLRPGVNLGEPFLLQFREIFHRSGVVAEEVLASDAVVPVDPEIQFCDEVVDVDVVVESVCDPDALRIVEGKPAAVAGYGSARHRA